MRPFITLNRALCLLSSALLAGCTSERPPEPERAEIPAAASAPTEEVHWGYTEEAGPEAWGTLSPEFATCDAGMQQSPIDLVDAVREELPDPVFEYRPAPLRIMNNGHTLQVPYPSGSAMTVGDTTYQLLQFHLHTPSEHRIDGAELPMELHLVHRGPTGGLAVVGVMVEPGAENAALVPLRNRLPTTAGAEIDVPSVSIDAAELLPSARTSYRYPGSLTTPPCTEGVRWIVLTEPIRMSEEQIEAMRAILTTSNRPVQPLGNRTLRLDS